MVAEAEARGRWRQSVRIRITALAAFAVGLVLATTGVILVTVVRVTLTGGIDDQLRSRADTIAAWWDASSAPIGAVGDPDDAFWQITVGAETLAASANVADRPPLGRNVTEELITSIDIELLDGRARMLSRPLGTSTGEPTVHVAMSLEDIDETAAVLAGSLSVGIPLVTGLLALLVWTLVGRTLAPVEAIRSEVAGIDGTDPMRRVSVPAHDDEIARLASTMNEMLARMAHTQAITQRFVGDASHELRSPLTRLRSQLETEGENLDRQALLDTVDEMQRLVEDLLLLARLDAGHRPPAATLLDLDDVVRAAIGERSDDGTVSLAADLEPIVVLGHERSLRRAIGNVIANAIRHAAGAVRVTLAAEAGAAVIVIEDDGPGIAAELRPVIFDRFVRTDEARSRSGGGTGLGLAIAREVLHGHDGTIELDPAHTGGARFVLHLPAVD